MPEKVKQPFKNKHIATFLTILPAAALMFTGQWKAIWPIFVLIPMVVMFLVTCFALLSLIYANITKQGYWLASHSAPLSVLAAFLTWEAIEVLRQSSEFEGAQS